ncbi:MAG: S1 RNA-binding domain-containing protein [Patescibacteria group bacterium]|nr:S1 RNA-binding domain-containing protein [Patescibacteria group bacterium]
MAKKSDTSSVTTMDELLAKTGYFLKGLKKGDTVEGTITKVTAREILVDVGGKSEGVVMDRELDAYKDMLMTLKPGDKVFAQVIVAENDRGQSVLSLRKFISDRRWEILAESQKSGSSVDVVVREHVRGGVLVEYSGIRGYIPLSQLDQQTAKQIEKLSGRRLSVKVVEADKDTNRLVFSQRAIAEAEAFARQKNLVDSVEPDSTVQAVITSVVPFGAFAKFTIQKDGADHEVDGLIHISEIAWEKVDDPHQYMKEGDTLKVKVIGVDKETGKVTLSIKQLLPDPWEDVLDMFEKDAQVKGTVSRVTPIGIFVTLLPGVEGLIHISKLAPGEEPQEGDEITCIVEDVQPEKRKISLSMALTEKPIGYR